MASIGLKLGFPGSALRTRCRLPRASGVPVMSHLGLLISNWPPSPTLPVLRPLASQSQRHSAVCAVNGRDYARFRNQREPEPPLWVSLIRDVVWSLRSLVVFLIEQPSQLQYIEWPTFQTTLKTSTFTLVLVAALIVALSSMDATLSYILALLLRRSA